MDFACINCGDVFKRYSTIQTRCRDCAVIKLQGKAPKPRTPLKRSQKPIKQRGKAAKQWDIFRDKVARPHLDTKFGIQCTDCGVYPPKKEDGTYYRHDVDHVLGKGSHHELIHDVTNMVYRCRNCHIQKTGVPQWTPKARKVSNPPFVVSQEFLRAEDLRSGIDDWDSDRNWKETA